MVAKEVNRQALESTAWNKPDRPDAKLWKMGLKLIERFGGNRGRLVMGVNSIMRILDDIANGDMDPPVGDTREGYIEKKRKFVESLSNSEGNIEVNPVDNIERYIIDCKRFAHALGFDIGQELQDFFSYFAFDAGRLQKDIVFSEGAHKAAYLGCQKATINGLLKVTNQYSDRNPGKWRNFLPAADAVFVHYTLRDYEEDREKGLINISQEAIDRLGIDFNDINDRFSFGVRKWFIEQAELGLSRLEQQERIFKDDGLPWLAKMLVPHMYIKPARKYFEAVLSGEK